VSGFLAEAGGESPRVGWRHDDTHGRPRPALGVAELVARPRPQRARMAPRYSAWWTSPAVDGASGRGLAVFVGETVTLDDDGRPNQLLGGCRSGCLWRRTAGPTVCRS
jgi:hypothetical protein